MFKLDDILSLTEFKRHTNQFVKKLKETGRPQVLTVNGRAEVVVHDAESYERMLDIIGRAETIVGIRRGLDSLSRGEGRPADEALEGVRRRLGMAREA